MTLSDRIAALSAPDRAMDAEIALQCVPEYEGWIQHPANNGNQYGEVAPSCDAFKEWLIYNGPPCLRSAQPYTSSTDAALTLASPALQAHTMAEAQKLLGPRGFTVGKFTEALAIAICVVALRERGL